MSDLSQNEVAVFNAARRLAGHERTAYLDAACAGNPAMRHRLDELLRVDEAAGDFLEKPARSDAAALEMLSESVRSSLPMSEKPGDRIGPYKLLQQIGEGGCGIVYMAEQEKPIRRKVALKVIKLGMDTRNVIARFEAERQALALMEHPNIAKVLDAGATETGRPYFVMELVRGIKITDYCDQQRFSTPRRLELFIQVCQAVQHAHQKGIIHRDLKPSNILVTEQDGAPVPKVIDFGIAKATGEQRLTDKTVFTAFEQFIGTPAYMSPEQAGLGGLDVDTRSDIYSLGVLLYELLTGMQPFDSARLRRSAIDEILRIIREQEPPRPSARLTTFTQQELTVVAQQRQTEPAKFSKLLRGDLDWIVMKTLEKERTRRYETANGLAKDILRHLNNEPVIARPPSVVYKLQRAVRRNRLAIVATAAIISLLALGVTFVPWRQRWQQMVFSAQDWQARIGPKTPVDNRLVLIGIDKESFDPHFSDEELQREPVLKELQNPWPWSRAVWARLLEKLSDAGAKVIVIDFVLSSQKDDDDALHQALVKYKDRVVIGYMINVQVTENGQVLELTMPNSSILTPAGKNSAVEDDRLGYVNLWPDSDDTLRRASFRQTGAQVGKVVPKDTILESLEARVLRKFGRPDLIPLGFDARLFRYTAPADQAYKPEPLRQVLSPKLWEKKYDNGKFFKDKIVLIGPAAELFHDTHNTPFTNPKPMSGLEIDLNILNAALHGEFLGERSPVASLFIIAMSGVIAGALRFLVRQPARRFLIVVGLSVAYVVFAQLLFDHARQVIPLGAPLFVMVVSSFIILAYDFVMERP
jgi:serine/threonine protein kinase